MNIITNKIKSCKTRISLKIITTGGVEPPSTDPWNLSSTS